ncbi:MAG: aspartyl/asparaginyl beta-hydroxylase domain-containing protein [Bdellovibrionaceae bacterium]|nr:aspartyl/asparaginyl beta-hydroxylase domain-containing protein [Bdellovibrionales bacterium]MCB9085005.1 aspartyl/asparaginyl beta-hydroxylase domain-containing protein [Pseudobdellovibrionaceae bacterium]
MEKADLPDFHQLFPDRDIAKEWNERLDKYEVPALVDLERPVDSDRLYKVYETIQPQMENEYEKWVMARRKDITHDYSPKTYYRKILTHPTELAKKVQAQVDEIKGANWKDRGGKPDPRKMIEALRTLNENYEPLFDERNYSVWDPAVFGTYLEDVFRMVKGRITRARFAVLPPNSGVVPHIGMVTKYTVRLHVPIKTNPYCFNFAMVRGRLVMYHMQPNTWTLLNTSYQHWAYNYGSEDRVHLILAVDGDEDLRDYYQRKSMTPGQFKEYFVDEA